MSCRSVSHQIVRHSVQLVGAQAKGIPLRASSERPDVVARSSREALFTMASKTGWALVGDRLMTWRISLVAVCRARAPVSSLVARLQLLEEPHVLDRDDRLVGEGLEQRDLLVGERPHLRRASRR